ncbi:MAG: hypothetical protein LBJ00_00030 [Planctomycetaceae bacterium]|jgi:hypothetical protein|nr:hypothetical protein [Planctomycetaceae bacterium]
MKRLFKGEAYRPTGYGITLHNHNVGYCDYLLTALYYTTLVAVYEFQ